MKEYRNLDKLCSYLRNNRNIIVKGNVDTRYVVGALALDSKGSVISRGENSYLKTHPMQKKFAIEAGRIHKVFLHAEIAALVRARSEVHTLIIARILHGSGEIAISKPCPICMAAIIDAKVKKVFYTNDEGQLVLIRI